MSPVPAFTEEQLRRMARLLRDYQLEELLEVMEAVDAAGRGYGLIEIVWSNHALTDIAGRFTRKPRPDQGDLVRPRK